MGDRNRRKRDVEDRNKEWIRSEKDNGVKEILRETNEMGGEGREDENEKNNE